MSTILKLPLSSIEYYKWPNNCLVCGKTTNKKSKLNIEPKATYHIFYYRINYYNKIIFYPLCLKHKIFKGILKFLTLLSFIGILCFGFLSLNAFVDGYNINFSSLLLLILSISLLIVSRKYQPIKLKFNRNYPTSNFVPIIFRNDQYAKEFSKVNGFYDDQHFKGEI
ncbi:MAG: hypothetical protein ABSE95_03430 [Thermodesulfobacteriota bacterium]|jgi:hypothetical protein